MLEFRPLLLSQSSLDAAFLYINVQMLVRLPPSRESEETLRQSW
jgi:hypothetical protein